MNHSQVTCPACKGTGKINPPRRITKMDSDGTLSYTAKALKREGYTIREIAKIMGYSHPGSISHLLSNRKL